MPERILVAEDKENLCRLIETTLSEQGYDVSIALGGDAAIHEIQEHIFDLVISDMRMPGASGVQVFREARQQVYLPDVILMTAFADTREAVQMMKEGATDYIMKDNLLEELPVRVRQVLDHRKLRQESTVLKTRIESLREQIPIHRFDSIVGTSLPMREARSLAERVAPTDANVLLTGESGTGKEVFAQAIHAASHRSDAPFVPVNCGALPETLLESELFGHEKGAFTGAIRTKPGRFEVAEGGTVFLDEIGELPQSIQVKLLRVLQDRTYVRVGGEDMRRADVRILAATNRDLEEMIHHGRFREDLYYRLNVFPIRVPPLRERKQDIPLLARHFVMHHGARMGKWIETIPPEVMQSLVDYDWPGNVRELQNVIERAVILSSRARLDLGDSIRTARARPAPTPAQPSTSTLEDVERQHILAVLESTGWRVSGERGAARILGLKRTTLESRMSKLGISRPG